MSKHYTVLKKERTKRNSFIGETSPPHLSSFSQPQQPLSPITRTSAFTSSFFEKSSPTSPSSPRVISITNNNNNNNSLVQQSPKFNPSSSFIKTSPTNALSSSINKFPPSPTSPMSNNMSAKQQLTKQEMTRRETSFNLNNLTKPSSPQSYSSSPEQNGLINADGEVMKHLPVDKVVDKKQRKKIIKQIYLGYELPDKKKPSLPRSDSKVMKETVASSMKTLPKVVKESYYQRPPTDSHKQSAKDIFKRRYSTKLGLQAPSTPGNPTKPQGRMRTFSLNTQNTPLNTTSLRPMQREIKNDPPPRRAFGSPVCSGTEDDSEEDSDPDSDESEVEPVENIEDDNISCTNYVESVGTSAASSLRSSVVNTPFLEHLESENEPTVAKSSVFVKLEKEPSNSSITNDMSLKDFGSFSLSVSEMLKENDQPVLVETNANLLVHPEEAMVEQKTPEKEPIMFEEAIEEEEFPIRVESRMDVQTPFDEAPHLDEFEPLDEEEKIEEPIQEEPMIIEKEPSPEASQDEFSEEDESSSEDCLEVERIATPIVEHQEVEFVQKEPEVIEKQEEPIQEPITLEQPEQPVEEKSEDIIVNNLEEKTIELPITTEEEKQIIEPSTEETQQTLEEEPKHEEEKKEEKKGNALVRLLKSGGKKLERTLSSKFKSMSVLQNERPSSSPARARRDSISSAPDMTTDQLILSPEVSTATPESKAIEVDQVPVVDTPLAISEEENPSEVQAPPIIEESGRNSVQEVNLEDLLSHYEESYVDEQNEFLQMVDNQSPSFNGLDESSKKLFDNVKRFEAIPSNILSRPTSASQKRAPNALFRAKTVTKIHSKDKKALIEEFLKEEEALEAATESPPSDNYFSSSPSSTESDEAKQEISSSFEDVDQKEVETKRREISFADNKLSRPTSAKFKQASSEKFTRPTTAHHLKSKDSPKKNESIQQDADEDSDVSIREVEESSSEEEQEPVSQSVKKVVFLTKTNVERFNESQGEDLERPLSSRMKKDKSPTTTRPTTASRIKFKESRCEVGPSDMELYEYDPDAGADRHLELLRRIEQQAAEDKFTEEFEWTRPVTPKVEYYDDYDYISRPGSARTLAAEPPEQDCNSDTSSSHSSDTNSILFEKLHTLSRPSSSPSFRKPRSASLTSRSPSSHHLIRKTYLPYQPESPPSEASEEDIEETDEVEVGKLSRRSSISSTLSSSPPTVVNSPTGTSPTFISLMKKRADSSNSLGQKPSSPSSKNSSRRNSKIIPFMNYVETESDATSEGSNQNTHTTVDLQNISTKFIDLNSGSQNVRRNSVSTKMLDFTSTPGSPRRLVEEMPSYPGYIPKFLPRPYSLPLLSKVRHGVVRLSVFMEMHLANDFQTLKDNATVNNVPYMEEGFDKNCLNSIINDENPYMFIRRTRFSTGFLICPLSTTPGTKNYLLTSARNVQSYLTTKLAPDNTSIYIEKKVVKISANFLDNVEVGEKQRPTNNFASVAEVDCKVEYCGSFYNTLNVNQDWAILSFTFNEDIKYIDREKYKFLKSGVITIPSPSQLFLLIKHLITKTAAKKVAKQTNGENVVEDYMMCVNGLYSDREELTNITKVTNIDDYSINIVRESMDPMACSLAFLVKGSSFSRFEYANYSTPSFTGAPITACAISMEGLDEVLKESDRRHGKKKNTLRGKIENQNIANFAKTNSCVFTRYAIGIHSTVSANSKFHGVGCSVMNWFETFFNLVYKPNRRRFSQTEKELIELEYESFISLSNGRVPNIPGAGSCKVM